MRLASHAPAFAFILFLASIVAFLREIIIARIFGTGMEMDCFIAAYVIITFLSAIFGLPIMQNLLMPVYQAERRANIGQADIAFNSITLLMGAFSLLVSAACYIAAPWLIHLTMPGFETAQIDLGAKLLRTMLPLLVIYSVTNLVQALSNSHQSFLLPLSSQLVNNLLVVGLLFVVPIHSVETLAHYHVYGGIAATLMLVPCYFKFVHDRRLHLIDKQYASAIIAASPLLLLAFLDQCAQLMPRSFASMLEVGDIAPLNYAFRLILLVAGVVSLSMTSLLFPRMIDKLQSHHDDIGEHLGQSSALLLYVLCPIALFLAMRSHAIVELLFASKAFGTDAVDKTASALTFYTIGMIGYGYLTLLNRIYAACRAYKAYAIRIVASFITLVALSWALLGPMGQNGLALAFSLYACIATMLLIHGLKSLGIRLRIAKATWINLILGLVLPTLLLFAWPTHTVLTLIIQAFAYAISMAVILRLRHDPVWAFLGLSTPSR